MDLSGSPSVVVSKPPANVVPARQRDAEPPSSPSGIRVFPPAASHDDPRASTPPPKMALSYFDVPKRAQHQPHPSTSSSIASSGVGTGAMTPGYDGLIDSYALGSSPASIASSRASPKRPTASSAGLHASSLFDEEPQIGMISTPGAAERLGLLFMDTTVEPAGRTPPSVAQKHDPYALATTPVGRQHPSPQTPTPKADRFGTAGSSSLDAYATSVRTPLANTAPLRTSKSHPDLSAAQSTSRERDSRSSPIPLTAVVAPDGQPTRMRSATFSQHRAARNNPPPPVTVEMPRMGSPFAPPVDWQTSPALSSANGTSSSSSGLSSPVAIVSSPRGALPSKLRGPLRLRAFDRVDSPTGLRAGSPLASPALLSPAGSPRPPASPRHSPKSTGSPGGYFGTQRRSMSSSSHRPSLDSLNVQAVANVEFEMVTNRPPPRDSIDTSGSMRHSVDDGDGASDEADSAEEHLVVKPSAEDRRVLRQSMIIAEAEAEAMSQGLDSNGFYTITQPSTDSFASSFRGSSIMSSGPPSPTTARQLETHRNREQRWLLLMRTPIAAARKGKKLKSLVRAGIPASVRAKAWTYLCEIDTLRRPGVYHVRLLSLPTALFLDTAKRISVQRTAPYTSKLIAMLPSAIRHTPYSPRPIRRLALT